MAIQREETIIKNTTAVVTQSSLVVDFKKLGITSGMVLLVHSSLSKLGWVCGGAVAVILALEEVLGAEGTLIMPAHCGENSDPAKWSMPPVPADWVEIIRQNMPAYNKSLTPSRSMGRIAETFRYQEGVFRSEHPQDSFCAFGKHAQWITENHNLESALGEGSPLQKIYDLDGWILLLGVTHSNNTSLHLAEYRADFNGKKWLEDGCAMMVNGKRQWVNFTGLDLNSNDFDKIGKEYAEKHPELIHFGKAGQAETMLLKQKPLVDFATIWMQENRNNTVYRNETGAYK